MRGRWSKDNGVGDEGREIRERASQKRKETMKKMTVFRDLYKFEYMKQGSTLSSLVETSLAKSPGF